MIHWSVTIAPPQACMVAKRRDTCHGHELGQASRPPMIRVSISVFVWGGNARTPFVSATPRANFLLALHEGIVQSSLEPMSQNLKPKAT